MAPAIPNDEIRAGFRQTPAKPPDFHQPLTTSHCFFTLISGTSNAAPPFFWQSSPKEASHEIEKHHHQVAAAYSLSEKQAGWLNATIAFHCIAVADTIYSVAGKEPIKDTQRAAEEAEMEAEFIQSMEALIIGALTMINQRDDLK